MTPASIDGNPVTAPQHPAIHCTGSASTGPDILAIVLIVVLLATPILTAIYLARKADKITPATA